MTDYGPTEETPVEIQPWAELVFSRTTPVSRELFRITGDGRVIRNPEVTWDECAQLFWEAVDAMRNGDAKWDGQDDA
jgi:hypothetical protein